MATAPQLIASVEPPTSEPLAAAERLQRRRTRHVIALSLGLAAAAVLLAVRAAPVDRAVNGQQLELGLLLAVGFAFAEVVVLHFEIGDQAHSASLSEIVLVVGLFTVEPHVLLVARVVGAALALRLHRRQNLVKLGFNMAQFSLEATVAVVIFRALTDGEPILRSWGAAALAALVAGLLNSLAVLAAISLTQGHRERDRVGALLTTSALTSLGNATTAVVGVAAVRSDHVVAIPLAVVSGLLAFGYRAHVRLRMRQERLAAIYDFIRNLGEAGGGDLTREVLDEARRLLKADVAELTVLAPLDVHASEPSRIAVRTTLGADGHMHRQTSIVGPQEWMWSRVWTTGQPLLVTRNDRDAERRAFAHARSVRDAVIVPLPRESGVDGTLLVGGRRGEFTTFTAEDAQVLSGVATHAGVALANAQLVDRLTYESRHDALTGLPNRVDFGRQLDHALLQNRREGGQCAVLLMDLDRFKEVNDTLGHHAGDALLQRVAERLQACLRPEDVVARLGGDEFAVLLPDADQHDALAAATRIRSAITRPVEVEALLVDVGVSIGIVLAPDHGADSTVLLRHADVAMYDAKRGRGVDFYAAGRDESSASRLSLVADLRAAIDRDELELHYQPEARCSDGELVAVEALLRWHHPDRGDIPPDEFIPLAERSGMVHDITRWVVQRALLQLAEWRSQGTVFGVSINLSPRDLLDPNLPAFIADELGAHGLPPGAVTFEITEGSIMLEPDRAHATLRQLRAIGVGLAVDDFGTGYSSLAYLKGLPVTQVKIDRSFVRDVATDAQDRAIVAAICGLARSMGLEVVAEGVEDAACWQVLESLGCDDVQGWELARPMPREAVAGWIAAHPGRRSALRTDLPVPPQRHVVEDVRIEV